jgi:hypothetical protein
MNFGGIDNGDNRRSREQVDQSEAKEGYHKPTDSGEQDQRRGKLAALYRVRIQGAGIGTCGGRASSDKQTEVSMNQYNVDPDALGDGGIDPDELEDEAELDRDEPDDSGHVCDECWFGVCGQCDFYRTTWKSEKWQR